MVKKGFPSFGISQSGAFIAALKNYNLPDFILALVAKECDSELLERGRIDDRLSSMNDKSLDLLHRVFVDCDEDSEGKFGQLRFFSYVSSMWPLVLTKQEEALLQKKMLTNSICLRMMSKMVSMEHN